MEHNRDCVTIAEVYGNSNFADFPLNVNINDKSIAVKATKTAESPYLIKKHTQIAEFSVIQEQSKHVKPVDMAILSMIQPGDLDLSAYLNELLRTNNLEQQNNTFWFPTPENSAKSEDYTPIQTRILKEKNELKDEEKLNPQDSPEIRNNLLKGFDSTDTLLTKRKRNKQLKISWSTIMTFSLDTVCILR